MRITLLANPDNLHVQRWIEFLAGRGHALTLITDPFTRARPAACEIHVIRWNPLTKLLAFRLTPRPLGNDRWKHLHARPLVRRSRPDVVHGFEAFNWGLATALAGPYPRVLTPWGNDVFEIPGRWPLARRMIGRALRSVDAISTNDETLAPYLAREFGVDPARVHGFTWGVDPGLFHAELPTEAADWRRRLEIPAGAPVILSPRNFHPYWGSEQICGAIPRVLRQVPAAVFVILKGLGGDAAAFAEARRRLAAEGHGAALRWLAEPLAPREMAALFNLADAFISVPKTDLLAQTILEGMACGCFPVLGDRPAYRKHLRPGENGLLVEDETPQALAAALLVALANDTLRTNARHENPRLIAAVENWQLNAQRMEAVYQTAIERFGRSAG